MLVLMMVLAAVAVLADEPQIGTIVTQGQADLELTPVGTELLIPESHCSGFINKSLYDCPSDVVPSLLVKLSVTAKSNKPVTIEIAEAFGNVKIFGCGPVYVYLSHACRVLLPPGNLVPNAVASAGL